MKADQETEAQTLQNATKNQQRATYQRWSIDDAYVVTVQKGVANHCHKDAEYQNTSCSLVLLQHYHTNHLHIYSTNYNYANTV